MSRLSKNIMYNIFGQGFLLVLGFVSVKFIFKQLGEDALGIIYFSLSLNAVLRSIFEMGISSTSVRELSNHFRDDPGYIHNFIRTASLFYWGAYLLLSVIIYWQAPVFVTYWINLESMDSATAILVLQILGISVLTSLPRSLYESLFRGLERMEYNNIIDVMANLLQQLGIIIILVFDGGLLPTIYWLAFSFFLWMLLYLIMAKRFFSWRTFVPGYSSDVIKRNIRYSSNMAFVSISAMIHMQADKIIMSKFLPIGLLGFYGFAYSAVSRATFLSRAVAFAAFPTLSSLFKKGGQNNMMPQYRKLQDLMSFGTVLIFAACPFAVLPMFGIIFNPEVAEMLLLPITFLSIGFYLNGTLRIPHLFSLAVGKPEISSKTNFLALFIVLPITGLLIYYWGMAGAGFSWIFYNLFSYAYAVPRICSECIKIPTGGFYKYQFKIVVLTSLTYGIAWFILSLIDKHSIISAIMAYGGGSIIFLIASYFMISEEFRKTLLGYLQTIKSRVVKVFE